MSHPVSQLVLEKAPASAPAPEPERNQIFEKIRARAKISEGPEPGAEFSVRVKPELFP